MIPLPRTVKVHSIETYPDNSVQFGGDQGSLMAYCTLLDKDGEPIPMRDRNPDGKGFGLMISLSQDEEIREKYEELIELLEKRIRFVDQPTPPKDQEEKKSKRPGPDEQEWGATG